MQMEEAFVLRNMGWNLLVIKIPFFMESNAFTFLYIFLGFSLFAHVLIYF